MNEEVADNYVHSLDIVNCKCTLMPQLENSTVQAGAGAGSDGNL